MTSAVCACPMAGPEVADAFLPCPPGHPGGPARCAGVARLRTCQQAGRGARMAISSDQSEKAGAQKIVVTNAREAAPAAGDDAPEAADGRPLFHTGTKAVKGFPIEPSSFVDDFLTVLFQIGGRFLWANDNAQLAVGHIGDLIGELPLFMPLYKYFRQYGGVYKLSFAPVPQATFYVLSDPNAVKEVLSKRPFDFDKGLLAEILKPILGKGSAYVPVCMHLCICVCMCIYVCHPRHR